MSGKLAIDGTKRTQGMKVNLSPDMHAKLLAVSESLGLAPTLVATMAISEYVALKHLAFASHENRLEKTFEALLPHLLPMFQSLSEKKEETQTETQTETKTKE